MSENNPITPEPHTITPLPAEPVPAAGTIMPAPAKPKKNKKNKKKVPKQRPQNVPLDALPAALTAPETLPATGTVTPDYDPSDSLTEGPTELLTLPVKPDEWFIKPATYDDSGNMLTEETLIFFHNGLEILHVPFNSDNLSTLTEILTERFSATTASTEADFFHVRKPFTESDEALPVMTLTQKNRILATTSLDQRTLKKLIRALQSHVEKKTPITSWLSGWWYKHKIMRVALVILALPVVGVLLYSGAWGMGH